MTLWTCCGFQSSVYVVVPLEVPLSLVSEVVGELGVVGRHVVGREHPLPHTHAHTPSSPLLTPYLSSLPRRGMAQELLVRVALSFFAASFSRPSHCLYALLRHLDESSGRSKLSRASRGGPSLPHFALDLPLLPREQMPASGAGGRRPSYASSSFT